ncbi:MAG TPA: CPBP family intramembrane glutamic endopeptidase [Thermoguttaceae bacterium]|nr:CPBP family intramembrane glutamic endopeptidase [Thermoguttaceae bacterium]
MDSVPHHLRPSAGLAAGYWAESVRPMTSLAFIAPLLVIYELGVVVLGPESVRNGADLWLRELLKCAGFGQYVLLPVLTVVILLSWHHTTGKPWRLSNGVLSGMLVECTLLALGLCLILQLQGAVFQAAVGPLASPVGPPVAAIDVSGTVRDTVGFLGAGVYEELLFRLMLLPAVAWTLQRLGTSRRPSVFFAVLSTSLVFAAAHYVGDAGEALRLTDAGFWFSLTFRFLAGVFFSLLFVYRGFGIAAGTHAGYDILVGLF